MKITILVDDDTRWFIPYAKKLMIRIGEQATTELIHDYRMGNGGDISFLLSCSKITPVSFLNKYEHNIVVHASDLPQGQGFSPMKWQVLEGKNEIVLTLFEAVEKVDDGNWYIKDKIVYNGYELLPELQSIMAEKIISMCLDYVQNYKAMPSNKQVGERSWYPRFRDKDDSLDINKSIAEQFNHLRIADNDYHPLWFNYEGHKYYIKVYDDKSLQRK